MEEAQHSVERALRDQLLDPDVIATALKGAATELANGGDHERLDAARGRLAATELELKNLASAVAQGSDIPALLTLMSQRNSERLAQAKDVQQLQQATAGIAMDVDGIVRELLTVLPRWRELMSLNPEDACATRS